LTSSGFVFEDNTDTSQAASGCDISKGGMAYYQEALRILGIENGIDLKNIKKRCKN
jgi:signal-transduction protein with cAMP-binding, CBS, and nucleotidyltransferase domain